MITPEIAVLGVDDDCGPCAEGGLERLALAVPEVDWPKVLHDTRHNEEATPGFWPPYWCEHCEEE
jgi:hypothetical protein